MNDTVLLEQYACAVGLPVHILSQQNDPRHFNSDAWSNTLLRHLLEGLPNALPSAWTSYTPEHLYFGGIRSNRSNDLIVVGPVLAMECSHTQAAQVMYHLGMGKRSNDINLFRQAINSYPICNAQQLKRHILFLNHLINAEADCSQEHVPFRWPALHPAELEKDIILPETFDFNLPQNMENTLVAMIRWGKPEELATYCNEIVFSLPQHPDVDLRLEREYIIGANLLMSRVAAIAGVHTALLDEIIANNLYQIENCTSHTELSCLFFQFAMQYANQVKAVRSVSSEKTLAFQVNSYIRAHIYEKLTTSIVATGLNYSVSYLCAAFKQETGVTLTDYIQQEKISQARYLLEQHKKPADVSRLLEFSSPSYFGAVFRKLVGVSPGEYAAHAVHDFQANGHPFAWNP